MKFKVMSENVNKPTNAVDELDAMFNGEQGSTRKKKHSTIESKFELIHNIDSRFDTYAEKWYKVCLDIMKRGWISSYIIETDEQQAPVIYLIRDGRYKGQRITLDMHKELTKINNTILKDCGISLYEMEQTEGGFKWVQGKDIAVLRKLGKII